MRQTDNNLTLDRHASISFNRLCAAKDAEEYTDVEDVETAAEAEEAETAAEENEAE